MLPADPAPEEVAAAANIAGRLGFESSAFTPGLAVLDADIAPGAESPPLFLVGRSNRWVRQLEEQGRVQLDGLTPGQGLFAIVSSPFGGADAVVVAGADPAGTLYAANAAEVLDELAADHRVGQARFTDRRAVRLNY